MFRILFHILLTLIRNILHALTIISSTVLADYFVQESDTFHVKFAEAIVDAFVAVQSFVDMDLAHTADIGVLYEEDNACPVDQELYTTVVFLMVVQSNLGQGSLY